MKRTVTLTVSQTSRGVRITTAVHDDGKLVTSKTTTRLWGADRHQKALDSLLVNMVAGQNNALVREWMDQGELPF